MTDGSSPRGRGTGPKPPPSCACLRVIPAWAGNRFGQRLSHSSRTGHPRVGGEQTRVCAVACHYFGSSPRGRGTGQPSIPPTCSGRVIPAWAGNSAARLRFWSGSPGHPRVGGEQRCHVFRGLFVRGSSPRGRGTGITSARAECSGRVIPAWAGNRFRVLSWPSVRTGHPRVGGEQSVCRVCDARVCGSSPRGRGTDLHRPYCCCETRVIPAWAGNSKETPTMYNAYSGHPRVGGEQLPSINRRAHHCGSSPRGRGTGAGPSAQRDDGRVIPAWAGNSPIWISRQNLSAGHPRVGGEQVQVKLLKRPNFGSSPRGRGTARSEDRAAR